MNKQAITMTSMQSLLEELVDLTRDPTAVVRFKSLKASDQDSAQLKVLPWMLQITTGCTRSCRCSRCQGCGAQLWEGSVHTQ